jgi:hypothetical protein
MFDTVALVAVAVTVEVPFAVTKYPPAMAMVSELWRALVTLGSSPGRTMPELVPVGSQSVLIFELVPLHAILPLPGVVVQKSV